MVTTCTGVPRDGRGSRRATAAELFVCLVGLIATAPVSAQGRAWTFGPFEKPTPANPVISPSPRASFVSPMNDSLVRWEEHATFKPAAVVRGGKVFVLYRAEDASGEMEIGRHTSRLGLAESADGLRFARGSAPVLYPGRDAQARYEWPGGVEDPRIVETEDSVYVLTYTQWNRDVPRLAVATSRDLAHWTKHGPAFARTAAGYPALGERRQQRRIRRLDPAGSSLYGRAGAVRPARPAEAHGSHGSAVHPAHRGLRADRAVRGRNDFCGRAGAFPRTLVPLLWNGRLPGRRRSLESSRAPQRTQPRTVTMTLVKVAPPPPLTQDVDLTRTYDAVVVGSGAAGGMAAHVLTSKGMDVLMLEAGRKLPIEQELRSMQWPY